MESSGGMPIGADGGMDRTPGDDDEEEPHPRPSSGERKKRQRPESPDGGDSHSKDVFSFMKTLYENTRNDAKEKESHISSGAAEKIRLAELEASEQCRIAAETLAASNAQRERLEDQLDELRRAEVGGGFACGCGCVV